MGGLRLTQLLPLLALTSVTCSAQAYVDPNSAGFLFQLILPIVAAVVGWWTLFKGKVKSLFGRLRRKNPPAPPGTAEATVERNVK